VAADPTLIRAGDRFYLFATNDDWGDGQGLRVLPIFASVDLVSWTYSGTVFSRLPRWKSEGSLWAPEISYRDGEYRLYYSYSRWDDPNPCIGMAGAGHPEGPWTDAGRVFCSDDVGVDNSIDPFAWHDDAGSTLIWGSFNGIYAMVLSEDGRSVTGAKTLLADNRFEGANVIFRRGYYYLFVSAGSCCEGAESTYRVYVGRSNSLTGPYVDQQGRDLRHGGGMLLLSGNDSWAGPGHNSVIADDAGNDWIVYHAIPRGNPTLPSGANRRPVHIDQLKWRESDWPYLETGLPDDRPRPGPVVK
jgi:arabinan endo-1,5-alpha-L-arabinosidase